jgi:hypothetical protein
MCDTLCVDKHTDGGDGVALDAIVREGPVRPGVFVPRDIFKHAIRRLETVNFGHVPSELIVPTVIGTFVHVYARMRLAGFSAGSPSKCSPRDPTHHTHDTPRCGQVRNNLAS